MMVPDYTHWHGMYDVAERFYMELIPQAREVAAHAGPAAAGRVNQVIEEILARPEHAWFQEGAENQAEQIREFMEARYGQGEHVQGGGR